MRILLYALAGLLSFAIALAGAMAATGNLNADAVKRLLGEQKPGQESRPAAAPAPDELGALARRLKEREEALDRREADLVRREAEFAKRSGELQQLQTTIEDRLKEIQGALAQNDTELQARRQTTASTLERMEPKKAAERMNGMPAEEAAEILRLVKDKQRAKIIEQLQPDEAVRLLRLLQEPAL